MQVVIDIPEEEYQTYINHTEAILDSSIPLVHQDLLRAVINGTPLPKGHGRLIDADRTLTKAWANFYKHEDEWEKKDSDYLLIGRFYDQKGFECCQQTIVNAPTIIEADKSESEDKE